MKTPKAHEVKHRPGTWCAKGIDPITLKRKSYYGKSPEEATRKAAESLRIAPGPELEIETLYGFYAKVYLRTVGHRSYNWTEQIGWAMDRYIIPTLGDRLIKDLSRSELQAFFNTLTHLAPSSQSKVKGVLSGVLNLAVDDELISKNPLSRVRLPKSKRPEKNALTPEELHRLIAESHALVRPFVILAGCAGLRLGEAVGVTWAAIDRDGLLSVHQQVQQRKGGTVILETLKTEASHRKIPLPEAMVDDLHNCGQVSGIWVCSDTLGGYIKPKNVTRELAIACRRAGVPVVTPHELRHTFITNMENVIAAPRAIISAVTGHVGQSITDAYSHPKRENISVWMERYWNHVSTCCRTTKCPTESKNAG